MKKTYFLGLILASVSTVALAAQDTSVANEIVKMVKNHVMSADVEYKTDPSIRPVVKGFEVSVPDGTAVGGEVVSGFSFPVMEDGTVGSDKSYTIKLDKLAYFSPSLEKVLKERKASYSGINYVAKFIPALGFIEKQEVSVNDLKVPFENSTSLSVSSLLFSDVAKILSDSKVKQEDKMSAQGITLSHPLASLTVQSADFAVSVPETSKAHSPLEQIINTPHVEQNMSFNGVKFSSFLPGKEGTISFNLKQLLDLKQDMSNQNLTVSFNLDLNDIKQNGIGKELPSQIAMDVVATGFTVTQLTNLSEANGKLAETEALPESPRKSVILKSVQKEIDDAMDALLKDMKIDVNKISVDADKYAIVLKGKAVPERETFQGTLQITNFEYLAPEPRKIDEAACQELINQMLENRIKNEEFRARYDAVCDEGRGVLDALRPFASTASKVKDEKGKDALQFKIETNKNDLFINGQKVSDEMLDPMVLLGS
ncbi:MAG: hypothetical protein J6Y03_06175 [Alphaproteobacteria bacterium]|nr:hypothetical protein [Alphaproteobacteria bacterium]